MAELTCAEFVELVTEFLDGTLRAEAETRFREHLAMCAGCRPYLQQFEQTVRALGALPAGTVSVEARSALLKAFRDQ